MASHTRGTTPRSPAAHCTYGEFIPGAGTTSETPQSPHRCCGEPTMCCLHKQKPWHNSPPCGENNSKSLYSSLRVVLSENQRPDMAQRGVHGVPRGASMRRMASSLEWSTPHLLFLFSLHCRKMMFSFNTTVAE